MESGETRMIVELAMLPPPPVEYTLVKPDVVQYTLVPADKAPITAQRKRREYQGGKDRDSAKRRKKHTTKKNGPTSRGPETVDSIPDASTSSITGASTSSGLQEEPEAPLAWDEVLFPETGPQEPEDAGFHAGDNEQPTGSLQDAAWEHYQTLVGSSCADFCQISNTWCVVQGFDRRYMRPTVSSQARENETSKLILDYIGPLLSSPTVMG